MGLKGFNPASAEIAIPNGGTLTVRGLALEDLAVLVRKFYDPLNTLFDKYIGEASAFQVDQKFTKGELGLGDFKGIVLDALEKAPALITEALALATDDFENVALYRLLPVGTRIEAIERVVTLTLEAEGGLEKLMETVSKVTTRVTDLVGNRSR